MCASTLGWEKLVDGLCPAQFDLLVKVLSLYSFVRDFRHLLTPLTLQEVFDYPKEFILSKVPQLNFEGSGGTRAKECVQSHILSRNQEAS